MKKFVLSIGLIAAFAAYAVYQKRSDAPVTYVSTSGQTQPAPAQKPAQTASKPVAAQKPAQTNADVGTIRRTSVAASTPSGYRDGSYTGDVADAYFGNVQVKVTIHNGKIADVNFLQYPSDRGTSIEINSQAMPILSSEAVQSQTANVDLVSGATQTSLAFRESLGAALAQASS